MQCVIAKHSNILTVVFAYQYQFVDEFRFLKMLQNFLTQLVHIAKSTNASIATPFFSVLLMQWWLYGKQHYI